MTKIRVSSIFDVAQVAATKAYKELSTFVDYVNSLSDPVVQALTNGISFRDNLDCTELNINMPHDTPTAVANKRVPIAVYLARQVPSTPMVTAFSWSIDNDGALSLRVKYDTPPPTNTKIECRFFVHYS
jgi:hypothetical protein